MKNFKRFISGISAVALLSSTICMQPSAFAFGEEENTAAAEVQTIEDDSVADAQENEEPAPLETASADAEDSSISEDTDVSENVDVSEGTDASENIDVSEGADVSEDIDAKTDETAQQEIVSIGEMPIYEASYGKLDLSDKKILKCSGNKSTLKNSDGGTDTASGWTITSLDADDKAYKLIDGVISSSELVTMSNASSTSTTYIIDLGHERPIDKMTVSYVSASAIVGFAGETDTTLGEIGDDGYTLNQNWARVNNSARKNLSSEVSMTYGTKDSQNRYDTVTMEGEIGTARYVLIDGNGSSSVCSEIELYYEGEPVIGSIDISGDTELNAGTSGDYTAVVRDQYGDIVDREYTWTVSETDGITSVVNSDGSLTVSADETTQNGSEVVISAVSADDSAVFVELTVVVMGETNTPTPEPATPEPITESETQIILSDKAIINYSGEKANRSMQENGTVETSGWTAKTLDDTDSAYNLTDGEISSDAFAKTGASAAYVIDLGHEREIAKVIAHYVSSSAIVGFAGETDTTLGEVTSDGYVLRKNWLRMNNSNWKNLDSQITVTYGDSCTVPDKGYETVTIEGDIGNARYIFFDGNGSASSCAEIEVFYKGDAVIDSVLMEGSDELVISGDGASQKYTAAVYDSFQDRVKSAYSITAGLLPQGVTATENSDGSLTLSATTAALNGSTVTLTAKSTADETKTDEITVTVKTPVVTSIEISGSAALDAFIGREKSFSYTAAVKDQNGGDMANEGVSWSVKSSNDKLSNALSIDENGTMVFDDGSAMSAGKYQFTVTAVSKTDETVSASLTAVITVQSTSSFNTAYGAAVSFRGQNGAMSQYYIFPDDTDHTENEIQGHSGFGFIARYSFDELSELLKDGKEVGDFKLVLAGTGNRELGVWIYDGAGWDSSTNSALTYEAVKELLPTWGTSGGVLSDSRTEPLAYAAFESSKWSIDLKDSCDEILKKAEENGYVDLLITTRYYDMKNDTVESDADSASEVKPKITLTGTSAPHFEITTRDASVAESMAIIGDDTLVISGDKKDEDVTSSQYKAEVYSQYSTDDNKDIMNVPVTWSISGNDNVTIDENTGVLTISRELPVGEHTLTIAAKYSDTINAKRTITIEKRDTSNVTSMTIDGEKQIELLESQLAAGDSDYSYTVYVYDQFGALMDSSDINIKWELAEAADGYKISDGVLTISSGAKSAELTIRAADETDGVSADFKVEVIISRYPSKISAAADVLFRTGSEKQEHLTGPDLEIRNFDGADRGFSAGLKFDVSSVREAINEGYPIESIKLRLTTSMSKDGKLVLKEFSNDWDEGDYTLNSFDNKKSIIDEAIDSQTVVVTNDSEGVFTLERLAKDKRIYDGERGDSETIESWQTKLDIMDYIESWISANPTEDYMSLLLIANYNGTNSNTIFSKDVSSGWSNWTTLIKKFPELEEDPSELYPTILVDYAQETVDITAKTESLPIPDSGSASTVLQAVYHDPFGGGESDSMVWSITRVTDEDGNTINSNGVSIDQNGCLSVTSEAAEGKVTVRAAYSGNTVIYAEKIITLVKPAQQLQNGSFEDTNDAMMPENWTSYDPEIDDAHNGIQGYEMNQASETALANFLKTNDTDGYLTGTHSAEDPAGVYGKRTVRLEGAHGIDKDYEGTIYTNNSANSAKDGGPDLRVSPGVTYWVSQDYHLEDFYQLSTSSVVGPYVSYEGFQGTTGKSTTLSGSWYIKDGSATEAYTTDGYDTVRHQVTIPQNINRLRINWGLKGAEGSIYFHNFRLAPQGIDTSKTPVDGANELKVTGEMKWTSAAVTVSEGKAYTYKASAQNESQASGLVAVIFKDAEGSVIERDEIQIDSANKWLEKIGELTAPEDAAYAQIELANKTGSGSVWYDNIIFTETTQPKAAYVSIEGGNELVVAPLSGNNSYTYTAKVSDQYNNSYDGAVEWTVSPSVSGISIENGVLTVESGAVSGQITIKAAARENELIYAQKTVTVITEAEAQNAVQLTNGSFSDYDTEMLPVGWTDSDRIVSIANGSFDSSISGWKLNYTSYTDADTSAAMEWDDSVDHTGNGGGSARIKNEDRAQGSMQISQNADIRGGNSYDLSVWVKTDHVSSDSNVYATMIFYDENGKTIEENKQALVFYPKGDSYGNNTSDWTKLSATVNTNSEAVKLRIDLRYRGGANNREGTVWFDDLEIKKQAGMDTAETYNGAASLMLAGYAEEDADVSRGYGEKWDSDPITGITAGASYAYSVYAQTFNADEGGYVTITYYDKQGRELSSVSSNRIMNTVSSWSEIKGSATAPSNASYAVMSLCIDGTGKIWFANASFEAGKSDSSSTIDSSNTGGSSGGGGGGGSGSGGSGGTAISGSGSTDSGKAMGNFSAGSTTASTSDTASQTVGTETLIPQPDPTYFTQGMDNIGGFSDIGRVSWAQKAIVALANVGIVNGKEEGKFCPDDNVTRAEFVKMLMGMLEYAGKVNTENYTCDFADVAEDAWYHDSVALAVNNGIVTGISDSEFRPDRLITRQDMAVMVYRAANAAGLSVSNGAELIFTDEDSIAEYAEEAVKTMAKAGIINGYDDGTFLPTVNATRAQAAVVIYRTAGGSD